MFCYIYSVIGILLLLCCCACKTALCTAVLCTIYCISIDVLQRAVTTKVKNGKLYFIWEKLKANFVVSNLEESSYMGVIHHEVDTGCMLHVRDNCENLPGFLLCHTNLTLNVTQSVVPPSFVLSASFERKKLLLNFRTEPNEVNI